MQRHAYFVAVLAAALASVFPIAPGQHHRLRWRHRATTETMALGQKLATTGTIFLSTAAVSVAFLVAYVVHGTPVAFMVATVGAGAIGTLRYALPLSRRLSDRRPLTASQRRR